MLLRPLLSFTVERLPRMGPDPLGGLSRNWRLTRGKWPAVSQVFCPWPRSMTASRPLRVNHPETAGSEESLVGVVPLWRQTDRRFLPQMGTVGEPRI